MWGCSSPRGPTSDRLGGSVSSGSRVAVSLLCHPGKAPLPLWTRPTVALELLQATTFTCPGSSSSR